MYKAENSGSTTGKSGKRWLWNAGDEVDAPKGELDHVPELKWSKSEKAKGKSEKESDDSKNYLSFEDLPEHELLAEAGLDSLDKVAGASDEELTAVNGIGPATVKKIRESLNA